MKAYWLVLDNPYFAVTDDKGNFEIKNVPAGTQKVVVWQEAARFVTAAVGRGRDDQGQRHDHARLRRSTPAKVKPASEPGRGSPIGPSGPRPSRPTGRARPRRVRRGIGRVR